MRNHLLLFFSSLVIFSLLMSCGSTGEEKSSAYSYDHPIDYSPSTYVCVQSKNPMVIDGKMTEEEWGQHEWTEEFVDIEGELKDIPTLSTQAKMTWDSTYFYIAAKLNEPHIWAKLKKRDDIIFFDDDFEVFIDPDADGHDYFEFEMNALNTVWDLILLYPYGIDEERNYFMHWDVPSIKSAVHLEGTLNNPADEDEYWSVEIAIPWACFTDLKTGSGMPSEDEVWRVNFSRVDWPMTVQNGIYEKKIDPEKGKPVENNWVWSPTGYINMHKPELWGYVQFNTDKESSVALNRDEEAIRWGLWQLYYQMKQCKKENEECDITHLTIPNVETENTVFDPRITSNEYGFWISSKLTDTSKLILDNRAKIEIVKVN